MEKRARDVGQGPKRRVRRGVREIVLAVMLTVAAVIFIAAAWLSGGGGERQAAPIESARKPSGN